MKKYIFLFAVVFFMVSCKRHNISSVKSALLLKDSIVIPNANMASNHVALADFCYLLSDNHLDIWYFSSNCLYRYDLVKKQITDSLNLPKSVWINSGEFCVDSAKKAYFLQSDLNRIRMHIGDSICNVYYRADNHPKRTLYSHRARFDIAGNKLLLYSVPDFYIPDDYQRLQYFSSKILSIFNIDDTSLVEKNSFGDFPKSYSDKFYYDFYPISFVNGNYVYYCFDHGNTIYRYDTRSNKVKSNEINNLDFLEKNQCPIDSLPLISYVKKYMAVNNEYICLTGDVTTNNLLLLEAGAVNYKPDSLGHLPFNNKPITGYVIDSNFNCTRKIDFPTQLTHTFGRSFYYNHRLYIPRSKFGNTDKLIFDVYEI